MVIYPIMSERPSDLAVCFIVWYNDGRFGGCLDLPSLPEAGKCLEDIISFSAARAREIRLLTVPTVAPVDVAVSL